MFLNPRRTLSLKTEPDTPLHHGAVTVAERHAVTSRYGESAAVASRIPHPAPGSRTSTMVQSHPGNMWARSAVPSRPVLSYQGAPRAVGDTSNSTRTSTMVQSLLTNSSYSRLICCAAAALSPVTRRPSTMAAACG